MRINKHTCAAVFGFVGSFGFAPYKFFLCTIASLVWLYCTIKKADSTKIAFKTAFCWFFTLHLSALYWVVIPLTINGWEFAWLIPFAICLIPAFLAAFYGSFVFLFHVFCNLSEKAKSFFPVIFALFWCVGEVILANIPILGFPWNLMGYVWCFSIYTIQSASLFWVYGLSFLLVLISALLGEAILTHEFKSRLFFILSASALIVLNFLFGFVRLHNAGSPRFTNIKVAIVQGNIRQDLKWKDDQQYKNFIRYIDFTNKLSNDVNIVVWPESAVTFSFYPGNLIAKHIAKLTMCKKSIITGGIRVMPKQNDFLLYNSMFSISPSGEVTSFYDKQVLLPFGEYIPFRKIFPIKKITYGSKDYSPGKTGKLVLKVGDITFLPKICSEMIFPIIKTGGIKVSAILNIANDDWFGRSSEPYQHLEISRIRCVELGIPLIRVSNSGISAVFDSYGRETEKIGHQESGVRVFFIPQCLDKGFMAKHQH